MKRTLLLVVLILASINSFATTHDTLFSIITKKHPQLDSFSALPLSFGGSTKGYLTGLNSNNWIGYAEAYNPPRGNWDTGWSVVGCLSIWYGTIANPTNTVKFQLWDIDSSRAVAHVYNGLPTDSISGFPKALSGHIPGGKSEFFSLLQINHAPTPASSYNIHYTDFGGAYKMHQPFFLGFEFGGNYWGGGDTVGLVSTNNFFYNTTPQFSNYYFLHNGTADTMYLSRSSYEDFSGTWHDFSEQGDYIFLSIVPLFDYYHPTGVSGITKNNLTFFGTYPNPATNNANVKFSIVNPTDVTVTIMDINGRVINTLENKGLTTGEHVLALPVAELTSGTYMCMVRTAQGDAMASKFTVVK